MHPRDAARQIIDNADEADRLADIAIRHHPEAADIVRKIRTHLGAVTRAAKNLDVTPRPKSLPPYEEDECVDPRGEWDAPGMQD